MEKGEDALRPGTPPPSGGGERPATAPWWFRLLLIFAGLAAWFWTQSLIGARQFPGDRIGDGLHDWSAPANAFLHGHPAWADGLLITSSALIDSLGFFLLARSVFWPTIRPFLGLMILLGLRQIFQGLCALPAPEGMIWRYPGFPSLLVTYGVSNDLFFSGHTGVAVFGAVELGRIGWRWLTSIAVAVAAFEVATVLVLRAHYTMDVFAGAVTAMLVAVIVAYLAPPCDQALGRAFAHFRPR
jgi:hypothetical protein